MAIDRRLVAQDDNDDNQWLKVDHSSRYISNDMDDWQFLFGPNSSLSNATQVIKLAGEFDQTDFDGIRLTAYLYQPSNGTISNAGSCTFTVYKVTIPDWTEVLQSTFSGTQIANSYYYSNITSSSLSGIDFFGGDTIMVEAVIDRLGVTYRDRIYINHLGIYDNVTRLRQDVEFLDISKVDE